MDTQNSKRDILDWIFTYVNKTLLVFKLYYFFYFAAFGSLFPLISVYFKQIGFNSTQCGILLGSRCFVEFISTPFWGIIAERLKKGKILIIISIIFGLCFTIGISVTRPIPEGCLIKGDLPNETKMIELKDFEIDTQILVKDDKILYPHLIGQSPIRLADKDIIQKVSEDSESLVFPVYSPTVYQTENIYATFVVIFILMVFGEFFSSPSLSLADVALLSYIKDDKDSFGRQRLYGSIGWGLAMFFVGIALDNAVKFYNHPCGWPGEREKNYVVCFAIYSVFMCFTLITSTQITFCYDNQDESMYFKVVKDRVSESIRGAKTKNRQQLVNEEEEIINCERKEEEILERQLSIKLDKRNYKSSKPENSTDNEFSINAFDIDSWVGALKIFTSVRLASLLFLSWFMGFGVGILFTFLFWHLQDIGGTPTLFGLASLVNHLSEIAMWFFSGKLISTISHTKVLYLALVGNIFRFFYISWIKNPWLILPVEILQGLTYSAMWAASLSYMAQIIPKEFRYACQRILNGMYNGIGKGCGSIFGGLIIGFYGTPVLFKAYAISCCVVLIAFLIMNYFSSESVSLTANDMNIKQTSEIIDHKITENYDGYDQPTDIDIQGNTFTLDNDYGSPENYNSLKGNEKAATFRQY